MLDRLKKDNKGFTIIEVLIVLAIGGLIMLIVFLAVPALQRNQRNSARNSDASRYSAAITECLANRNGQTASCTAAVVQPSAGTTTQLTTLTLATTVAGNTTTANYAFNLKCSADGSSATATGATSRDFAVQYKLESGSGTIDRCISS
jgi:prepilin-type N-terminal cleavage/methylation domain-containing protein